MVFLYDGMLQESDLLFWLFGLFNMVNDSIRV